ncbi:MAG: hypothetical protein H6760_02325 [Candidatus Nomurabacteria bacterium]|nr:MAG: hypothetical protein H6760_02325 [Candidatus Nomurabacteria bacterium]
MHWEKLGKIFDPSQHNLPNDCKLFAQSPQVLLLDDRIRIYFSTRQADTPTTYLSHIAYVDFTNDFSKVLEVSKKTVLPLGKLGTFDEHGIFPMNVLRFQDRVLGFTSGISRRSSVSVETSIGLVESFDNGESFQRNSDGPILTSSLHEPFMVGDPFVQAYEGKLHMWYINGVRWKPKTAQEPAARVYKIAHATSLDAIHWQNDNRQIISDVLNADECQALPTVIKIKQRYYMYFCYREASDFRTNKNRAYRIGCAYSDDLTHWTRDDAQAGITVSDQGWDSEMQCYPHVFQKDDVIYLLYNGNAFGRDGFGLAKLVG